MAMQPGISFPFLLCLWLPLFQASPISLRQPADAELSAVLTGLNSERPEKREESLPKLIALIRSDVAVKRRTDVQVAMAALVSREADAIRNWAARARPGQEYDDEFYSGEVLPTAIDLVNDDVPEPEPALVAALVGSVYGTGSRLAQTLAGLGQPALSAVSKLSNSDDSSRRSNAYDILGLMLAKQATRELRQPLTNSSVARAQGILIKALKDHNVVARRDAVRAITTARYRGAIPALRLLAKTDPDVGQKGFDWNSVRGLAAAALKELTDVP